MPANVDELVVRVADICTYKWDIIRNRPIAYLVSGFSGGAMVVFGATLALSVSAGVPQMAVGLANLLMGMVFMFSLVIIMVSGMTLVTADMYIGMIGVFQGVLLGFLIVFRISDSSTLTAYAILVFAVQLILWIILGSWGLISTGLNLGALISQSREVLNRDSNSAEKHGISEGK